MRECSSHSRPACGHWRRPLGLPGDTPLGPADPCGNCGQPYSNHVATCEVRVTDPDTGGQKGAKTARFDLIPVGPLWELAECYGRGAAKYAANNWRKGYAWSLSYAAAQRHLNQFWAGESYDNETGIHHLASAAFHLFALTEFETTHPEKDDRPQGEL